MTFGRTSIPHDMLSTSIYLFVSISVSRQMTLHVFRPAMASIRRPTRSQKATASAGVARWPLSITASWIASTCFFSDSFTMLQTFASQKGGMMMSKGFHILLREVSELGHHEILCSRSVRDALRCQVSGLAWLSREAGHSCWFKLKW